METIDRTRIFVKVIQCGGFTKAAAVLRLPKSTLSKALTRLEEEMGTKLLIRTTRSHTLTETGRRFYETCVGPIQTLEDAHKSLTGNDKLLVGKIRITAPEDLGVFVITPAINQIAQEHPQLTFELHYSNQILDLVKDGFDLAIRIGALAESRLQVKTAGTVNLIAVAAPAYIQNTQVITHPKDLSTHCCLSLSTQPLNRVWPMKRGSAKAVVNITPRIECNQMSSLRTLALNGRGVAFVPNYLCTEDIRKKHLVRVLPDWCGEALPVSILSPVAIGATARLKLVAEHLQNNLKNTLKEP